MGSLCHQADDVAAMLRVLDDFADARLGEAFGPCRKFVLAGDEYFPRL